ncbi:MAG: hypothetical protein WC635_06025 [Bacteriovorax sp.]
MNETGKLVQSIQIEFCHPVRREETLTLSWSVLTHVASFLWFDLFCGHLKSDREYFTRFTGLIDGEKNYEYLLNSLNCCIDVINNDGRYFIKERATTFSQEFANSMHYQFELLCGSPQEPSEYFINSSPDVIQALTGINYFTHDLEAYTRNQVSKKKGKYGNSFSGIIFAIRGAQRFPIPDSFNKLFTMNIEFGDLVLHYSQVGKTWLESFYDQDHEYIFPHNVFSAEFDIMLGELRPDEKFLIDLNSFLKSKNLDPKNPAVRLGHLPYAKFNRDQNLSNDEYKNKLAYFCDIKTIKAFDDSKCTAQKSLENSTSLFDSRALEKLKKY